MTHADDIIRSSENLSKLGVGMLSLTNSRAIPKHIEAARFEITAAVMKLELSKNFTAHIEKCLSGSTDLPPELQKQRARNVRQGHRLLIFPVTHQVQPEVC
jgi:hypothetical protein